MFFDQRLYKFANMAFWCRGVFLELGHFDKQSSTARKKKGSAGKNLRLFPLETLENCTLNEKFHPQMTIMGAFFCQNQGTFFQFPEKGRGDLRIEQNDDHTQIMRKKTISQIVFTFSYAAFFLPSSCFSFDFIMSLGNNVSFLVCYFVISLSYFSNNKLFSKKIYIILFLTNAPIFYPLKGLHSRNIGRKWAKKLQYRSSHWRKGVLEIPIKI